MHRERLGRSYLWYFVAPSLFLIGFKMFSLVFDRLAGSARMGLPGSLWAVLNLALIGLVALGFCVGLRQLLLLRKLVIRDRGMFCRSCHYPLRGLQPAGECPECGAEYDANELFAYWKRHLAIRERAPVRVRDVVMVFASFVPAAGLCVLFAFHMLTEWKVFWMLPWVVWLLAGLLAIGLPLWAILLPSGERRVDSVE